jgi:serine protease DegQ
MTIEGRPVKDPQSMLDSVANLTPGRPAQFRLRRDKSDVELAIVIGKRPAMRRSSAE